MYEQGLGIDELDIEPNEKFTITEDFDATIENEKLIYKVISRVDNEMFETSNYDNIITLDTGKYLLQSDGKTIELLSSLD